METTNAMITHVSISDAEHGLSAWIMLEFASGGQGFGGYALDAPATAPSFDRVPHVALGIFVMGVMHALDAHYWEKLVGTPCRIKHTWEKVHAIGHFMKDQWFNPEEAFKAYREENPE